LKNKTTLAKVILIFGLFIPVLSFGYWKKHKPYTPYFSSSEGSTVDENKAGSDPLDPESKPVDTDGDGNPDVTDPDDDNDGIPDSEDEDDNNDGVPDSEEIDTDGDGIPDNQDSDDDNDGFADDTENKAGSDPLDPESKPVDTDGDGNPDVTDPDDDNDGIPDSEDEDDNNDGVPDSEEIDTDGDGIPDNQDSDDDNDGFADDTENKAGSDPLDPESKPNQEKLRLHTLIENEIRDEIRKLGCIYVYNKYFIDKKVPKSYPSGHNWNNWSRFDIKEFENLIWECKKDK